MLKPLYGKVIACVEKNDKTESGLVLTSNLDTDTLVGVVYSVSEYYDRLGSIKNSNINVGDKILISKFSGNKIEYGKKEYIVLDIDNILAKIEEE